MHCKVSHILLFFIWGFTLNAQGIVQHQNAWFNYSGHYKVSQKWGYQLEALFRLDNQLQQNLQNSFKIGGEYYLSSSQSLSLGYALVNTYEAELNKFNRENRLWEQYFFGSKWNHDTNTTIHRFRLEQRWVEKLATENGAVVSLESFYQNRLRYQNRNLIHLVNLKSNNEEIYAVIQDEVFVTLGTNKVNTNFIDQNRFLIGFGLNYNNNIRFEIGYLNQLVNTSFTDEVMNHSISISLLQNLTHQKQ
jgi:hypothetical protein